MYTTHEVKDFVATKSYEYPTSDVEHYYKLIVLEGNERVWSLDFYTFIEVKNFLGDRYGPCERIQNGDGTTSWIVPLPGNNDLKRTETVKLEYVTVSTKTRLLEI